MNQAQKAEFVADLESRLAEAPLVMLADYRGVTVEGEALDAAAIVKVADLPSKEELLVTLLRTIQEGPRQVLGVLQAPARDLLFLLKNYETKLADAGE